MTSWVIAISLVYLCVIATRNWWLLGENRPVGAATLAAIDLAKEVLDDVRRYLKRAEDERLNTVQEVKPVVEATAAKVGEVEKYIHEKRHEDKNERQAVVSKLDVVQKMGERILPAVQQIKNEVVDKKASPGEGKS